MSDRGSVDRYEDEPVGTLENKDGATWMTRIVLHPRVTWSGATPPADVVAAIHHESHHRCYIANSLKTEITVEASE
jgi:organic hydroperoxide reductase OsmC/OhrA